MNPLRAYMHPLALGPPSLLSILHIQIFTEHRAKLLADSRFPPVVYFTHGSVCIGEGNGTPLQYSCLENPMDGGAWKAAVHGVTNLDATSISLFIFMHWRRKWQPTPVFLPGESQGLRSLVGCHLLGCTELDTTEAT